MQNKQTNLCEQKIGTEHYDFFLKVKYMVRLGSEQL